MFIGNTVRSPGGTIEAAVLIAGTGQSHYRHLDGRVLAAGIEQPLYRRRWDGKIFVVGVPGRPYTLRVRNLTSGRIEVINTVDGRHTLDDEPGDLQHNRGLVFTPSFLGWFSGWRVSDQQTREFVFGSPERSIAAQATGSTENVGVIGFAAFRERRIGHEWASGVTRGAPATFGVEDATRGGSLGTGMGNVQDDRVGRTTFVRDGGDPDVLVIGYDTEEVLREQGIIAPAEPNPFPGVKTGYAKYASKA